MSIKRKELKKSFIVVGEEKTPAAPVVKQVTKAPLKPSFDLWWSKTQAKYKLDPEMKEAIKLHFKARGFMANDKTFEDGLKDFGFITK